MIPIKNELTDLVLNAPAHLPDDVKCTGLPIAYADNQCYSYWQLTFKEKLKVLFGKPIRLVIYCQKTNHPMVMLDLET